MEGSERNINQFFRYVPTPLLELIGCVYLTRPLHFSTRGVATPDYVCVYDNEDIFDGHDQEETAGNKITCDQM